MNNNFFLLPKNIPSMTGYSTEDAEFLKWVHHISIREALHTFQAVNPAYLKSTGYKNVHPCHTLL